MAAADWDWRPSGHAAALRMRAELLARVRAYFARADVLEVETPVLSQAATPDLHLASFHVSDTAGDRYLQTSPEYPMKRLLAAGLGSIYQICKVFRMEEVSQRHNPEFTLLEWYRVGFDDAALMDDVEQLLRNIVSESMLPTDAIPRITYQAAFMRALAVDPLQATVSELQAVVLNQGIDINPSSLGDDRDGWLQLLMTHCVEPHFADLPAWFITHFPASQAALARLDDDDPRTAKRFELYMQGIEIANGYQELTDAVEQRARFQCENLQRVERGLSAMPLDERFIAALQSGMPACAGVALGFDRLVMLASNERNIKNVITFSWDGA